MTDEGIKIDRTVPVSREDYDRMADQRDEFRKLAYRLKMALADARTALKWASDIANRSPQPDDLEEEFENFCQEDWYELTQDLDGAWREAEAALRQCPRLTG